MGYRDNESGELYITIPLSEYKDLAYTLGWKDEQIRRYVELNYQLQKELEIARAKLEAATSWDAI